jgi:hypothetical protein
MLYRPFTIILILLASVAQAGDAIYNHVVSPRENTKTSDYLAVAADQRATLRTTPSEAEFVAGKSSVVEAETKRHQGTLWVETVDTASEHIARSPAIGAYRGSYVSCTGEFKFGGGSDGGSGSTPTWKSTLKEKCGHIIIAWQYTADPQNPLFHQSGRNLRDQYIATGDPVALVKIGSGGDIANLAGLSGYLRSLEFTAGKAVSLDSIGHGSLWALGGDVYSSLSISNGAQILDVLPGAIIGELEDASLVTSDGAYAGGFTAELGCPNPRISLWHCFSGTGSMVGGQLAPSAAARIKTLMPSATVQGIAGLCVNPGPNPQDPNNIINL